MILRVLSVLAGWVPARRGLVHRAGARFFDFSQEAVVETKKVVWPSRKETMQTTGIVFAFVLVMAIVLWLTDKTPRMGALRPGSGLEEIMTKRWYVVHAYSGFEKSVQRALVERITRAGHAGQVRPGAGSGRGSGRDEERPEEHFRAEVLPRLRAGRDGHGRRLLAPGQEHAQGHRFVGGTSTKPTPISEKEVDKIMQQVQDGVEKPRPKVLFEVGEMVRIKEGPFTDFNGNVEEVNYEKSRLRVSVTIFGRATPVELEFAQVEKA
jgi:transcriptional antiterminator NusG